MEIADGGPPAAQPAPQGVAMAHQIAPGAAHQKGRQRRDKSISQAGHAGPTMQTWPTVSAPSFCLSMIFPQTLALVAKEDRLPPAGQA